MAEYSSFYGGRRGVSFIIKKSYASVTEMLQDFAKTSCEVNFGQYILINTENKNDPNNGALYRRGLDVNSSRTIPLWEYNETQGIWVKSQVEARGAEYIGTIAGPSGRAPSLMVRDYDDINKEDTGGVINRGTLEGSSRNKSTSDGIIQRVIVYDPNNLTAAAREEIAQGIIPQFIEKDSDTFANQEVLPGKYQLTIQEKNGSVLFPNSSYSNNLIYNNDIEYVSASFTDPQGQESVAYVGFKFPYHVFDFYTQQIENYGNTEPTGLITPQERQLLKPGINYKFFQDTSDIEEEQQDGVYQAYSSKYKLSIPKGLHGQNIQNFRIAAIKYENNAFKDENNNTLTLFNQEGRVIVNKTDIIPSDVADGTSIQVMLYDLENFDKTNPGIIKTYFLGRYNQISGVYVDEFGTIRVTYTAAQDVYFYCAVKWIYNVASNTTLSPQVAFPPEYVNSLPVKSTPSTDPLGADFEGRIIFYYNTLFRDTQNRCYRNYDIFTLDYVKQINVAQDGTVTYQHTDGNTETQSDQLTWIERAVIETRNGQRSLCLYKNNSQTPFETPFDFVNEIGFLPDTGEIVIHYESNKTQVLNTTTPIKTIVGITIAQDGTGIVEFNTKVKDAYGQPTSESETWNFSIKQIHSVESVNNFTIGSTDTSADEQVKAFLKSLKPTNFNNLDSDKQMAIRILLGLDANGEISQPQFSTLNNFFKVKYKGELDGSTLISPDDNFDYVDGFNEIEKITFTLDKPAHLLVLYSSLRKRINLIVNDEAYKNALLGTQNLYEFNGEIGWKDLGSLNSVSVQDLNFGWDITDDFEEYQQSLTTNQIYVYPHNTTDVINYLNQTYPTGLHQVEVPTEPGEMGNSKMIDFSTHLVTITIGKNIFAVTNQQMSYTDSEINGSSVFIPYQWVDELTSSAYEEPIKTFYGYNFNTETATFTTTQQLDPTNITIDTLRERYVPMIAQGKNIDGYPIKEIVSTSPYTYEYIKYRGWYNIQNVLGGITNSNSGSSSGGGTGSGDQIYFGSSDSSINNYFTNSAEAGSVWFVTN